MKPFILFAVVVLLSACSSTGTTTSQSTASMSNAQMAENFSNAVQKCVGQGLRIGSSAYENCVNNQLK
jgi:uncharacterized protein YceK